MHTETYVVRVYRRTANGATRPGSASLVGTVEQPDSGGKRPFHGVEELWDILRRRQGRGLCVAPERRIRPWKEVSNTGTKPDLEDFAEGVPKSNPP